MDAIRLRRLRHYLESPTHTHLKRSATPAPSIPTITFYTRQVRPCFAMALASPREPLNKTPKTVQGSQAHVSGERCTAVDVEDIKTQAMDFMRLRWLCHYLESSTPNIPTITVYTRQVSSFRFSQSLPKRSASERGHLTPCGGIYNQSHLAEENLTSRRKVETINSSGNVFDTFCLRPTDPIAPPQPRNSLNLQRFRVNR